MCIRDSFDGNAVVRHCYLLFRSVEETDFCLIAVQATGALTDNHRHITGEGACAFIRVHVEDDAVENIGLYGVTSGDIGILFLHVDVYKRQASARLKL